MSFYVDFLRISIEDITGPDCMGYWLSACLIGYRCSGASQIRTFFIVRQQPNHLNSRGHSISFDGGVSIPASASPHVVGKWADPAAVDPEEMLVAALSSCHMLTFFHVARLSGFEVTS